MKAIFSDLGSINITTDDSEERLLLKGLVEKASEGVVLPAKPVVGILNTQVLGGSVVALTIGFLPPVPPQQSTPIAVSDVVATNYIIGTLPDIVEVTNVVAGDLVKVYADASLTTDIAIGTTITGNTSIKLLVEQLGLLAGTVYVTKTSVGKTESVSVAVGFTDEI